MRGTSFHYAWKHQHQTELFSYGGLDERIAADHPLRRIRTLADAALEHLGSRFDDIYGDVGRPSIAPEKLLRAMLLQPEALFHIPHVARHSAFGFIEDS